MSNDQTYLVIFFLLVAGMGAAELVEEFRKPPDEPCYRADQCRAPADMPERDHDHTPFSVRMMLSANSSSSGAAVIEGVGHLTTGHATVTGHGSVSFQGKLETTLVIPNPASATLTQPST